MVKILITILWVLVVPIGIGAIVYNIKKNKWLGRLAALLAFFTCSSPYWTLWVFNWLSPTREALRQRVYIVSSFVFFLIIIGCPVIQTLLIKGKLSLRAKGILTLKKVILNLAGTALVFIYSLYVSAKAENRLSWIWGWIDEILFKRTRPFGELITTILAGSGEGLEILLLFLLALLSGYIIYPLTSGFKFFKRVFVPVLVGWLVVVSINEGFMQGLWIPGREWDFRDISNNMVGVSVGLLLSIRWFWKKEA